MKHTIIKILIGIASLAGMLGTLGARERSVSSEKRFYSFIRKNELAVVLFYRKDKEIKQDDVLYNQVVSLERMFSSTSRTPSYREAEIQFLTINVTKEKLIDLAQDFGVTSIPSFILFKDGVPVRKNGTIVRLDGFIDRERLINFIDSHFETRVKDIIKEKAEARKRAAEERRYWYYSRPYWDWGWGWGYPYYWGWPYYRYHYWW
jgi:hypothetical protein